MFLQPIESAVRMPAAALAEHPAATVSNRYGFVDTREVIELMRREGFVVAAAKTASPRKRDPLYAKHSIDFRHVEAQAINGAVPRLLFVNSHDGTTTANMMAGLYRFVCSNGLVVGHTVGAARLRHAGDAATEVIERARALARQSTAFYGTIEQWARRQLTTNQAREFARFAGYLRWGESGVYEPEEILAPRRAEDDRGDLWSVFNRIQENTVRGGLQGLTRTGRAATSRPLADITRDAMFNARLWDLASEVAEQW